MHKIANTMQHTKLPILKSKSLMFRAVFWVVLPCKMIVDRRFRGAYCLHHQGTSVDKHFSRQYNPEDSSEHHTRRRENLKSHTASHWFVRKEFQQNAIHSASPRRAFGRQIK
jgi:hypothetical protein